jgi:hypothetical protein
VTEQKIVKSNNSLFERDCERAGLPKDSLVSPALAKIVKAQNQARALHDVDREPQGQEGSRTREYKAQKPADMW